MEHCQSWRTKGYSFQHCARKTNKLFVSYKKKIEEVKLYLQLFFYCFRFGGCFFNKLNNAIGCYGKMLNFDDGMRHLDPVYQELKFPFSKRMFFCVHPHGPALPPLTGKLLQPRLRLIKWVQTIFQGECKGSDSFLWFSLFFSLASLPGTTNPHVYMSTL